MNNNDERDYEEEAANARLLQEDADEPAALPEGRISAIIDLQACLLAIAKLDPSNPGHGPEATYDKRNLFVVQALGYAMAAGYPCGFMAIDGAHAAEVGPGWALVFIDLPTGQVSWHLPIYAGTYDGHTTEEKYHRAHAFMRLTPGT